MKRGEFYLVRKPGSRHPHKQRVFVIVSRQALIDSRFSPLICAPVYSRHDDLSTQVRVGPAEGRSFQVKRSNEVDLEDPARRGAIVGRPARMDARIATDQLSVVHRKPVRVAGAGNQVDYLQHPAG